MKKTVKIISAVCAIVMLLGLLPVMSVSAADPATLVVTTAKDTVKAGREFAVTVSLANNPGLWSLKFELTYDNSAFEYVVDTTADLEAFPNAAKADLPTTVLDGTCIVGGDNHTDPEDESEVGIVSYNRGYSNFFANSTNDGVLAVIYLKAKEDAVLTDYTFTATIDAVNTTDFESNPVTVAPGSVTAEVVPNVAVSTIDSAMVKLGTDISVSFFATLDEDHAGAKMRFTFNEEETVVEGVATSNPGEYEYTFTGVAPQCMGDNIKAELIFNEEAVATKDEYSILANCQNLLAASAGELGLDETQYAAMKTLIADLLVYGAKAQVYNNYKTAALVDAGVTGATEFVALETTDKKANATKVDGVEFTAAGIFFDYINSIYVKFTAPGMGGSDLRITFGTQEYMLSECELIDEATSTYCVKLDPVSVLDYGTADFISIETYDSEWDEWNAAQKLKYSVNSYVYSMQNSANTKMADLAKALYNYGVSAAAFQDSFNG